MKIAFLFILLLCAAAPAVAEDFTFNVPVALYNMPASITMGRVQCKCTKTDKTNSGPGSASSKSGMASNYTPIGMNSKEFLITNGSYVGTVTVKFNVADKQKPADATDWSCSLALFDKSINKWDMADRQFYNSHNRSKPYKTSDQGYLK